VSRRSGSHWWWLTRKPDNTIVQAGGHPVSQKVVSKWDSQAAKKLNRMDRHQAKAALRRRQD
jgi:hypothetical protein